jgi:hypothetical protein
MLKVRRTIAIVASTPAVRQNAISTHAPCAAVWASAVSTIRDMTPERKRPSAGIASPADLNWPKEHHNLWLEEALVKGCTADRLGHSAPLPAGHKAVMGPCT